MSRSRVIPAVWVYYNSYLRDCQAKMYRIYEIRHIKRKGSEKMVNLTNLFYEIAKHGTAKQVSQATGISTGNISDWKSGRSFPTAQKLEILADYFDCTIDYLVGREERECSLPELTENEKAIIRVFKDLTDTQQGEIIGRAQVMAEQNDAEYITKDDVS